MSSETTTTATVTSTLPSRSPATPTPAWPALTPLTTVTAVNAESTTSPMLLDSDRSESKDEKTSIFNFLAKTKKELYSLCSWHLKNIVGVTFDGSKSFILREKIKFDFLNSRVFNIWERFVKQNSIHWKIFGKESFLVCVLVKREVIRAVI